jgi:hypothetical protein
LGWTPNTNAARKHGSDFPTGMKALYYLLGLWLATVALGAEPSIEFLGVLAGSGETSVSLADKSSGQTRWVKIGGGFGGYLVAGYEEGSETVVLKQGGQQFRLRLKTAKVKTGGTEPTEEKKRAILNNLRQLAAAADQFYLENGKMQATFDELVGTTKYVKQVNPVEGEDYRAIVFAQGKPLTVTTAGGFSMSYNP